MSRGKTVVLTSFAACIVLPSLASAPPIGLRDLLPRWGTLVERVASEVGVDAWLLAAIVSEETGWRPSAARDERRLRRLRWAREVVERHGLDENDPAVWRSYGLAQVAYLTAVDLGYRGSPDGLRDPEASLRYGARRLRQCLRSHASLEDALYAYCPSRRYAERVLRRIAWVRGS